MGNTKLSASASMWRLKTLRLRPLQHTPYDRVEYRGGKVFHVVRGVSVDVEAPMSFKEIRRLLDTYTFFR